MNNSKLLAGLLAAAIACGADCAMGASPAVVTLEEIFAVAEQESARLRPSLTAIDEADSQIKVAQAERLPDIEAHVSLSYIGDGFTTKRNFSDYEVAPIPHFGNGAGVSVSQPLYTGGAITAGIDLARLQGDAARQSARLTRENLRMELTAWYLDLYKYSNLRRVVESNTAQARKVLEQMHSRFEQGTALRNDITRYELLVSNLELQLTKIDNTLDILNRNLVITAGLPEGTVVVPDSTILSRSLPADGEAWWQNEAAANSPSLQLAQSGVSISRKAETIARSERLPKVAVQAAWTIDGPILVEVPPINRNLSYWYVGVGVSYNLSSLFKTNRKLTKARLSTQVAAKNLDAARQGVSLAVRSDYVRYLEAYEELKTQQKSVELAERNYNTTLTRYSADMALITDMLDAADSKLDAEQGLVNARINIIYYYYKLLHTSGKI